MRIANNSAYRKIKTLAAGTLLLSAVFMSAAQAEESASATPEFTGGVHDLQDLTAHPLAGTEVEIEVRVRDALGQEGTSRTVKVLLPKRNFSNPVAQEIETLRRDLALDSRKAQGIAAALEELMSEKAEHIDNPETMRRLETIRENLAAAESAEQLDRVVGDLWGVMLQLEEDFLTDAEKALRDAEKALREALEQGMDMEDLQPLVEDAHKAMEDYLDEKAESAAESGDSQSQENFERLKEMLEEIQKMLDAMAEMDPEAAQEMTQQLLEQMQQMQDSMSQSPDDQQQSQMDMQQQMQQMMDQMQQMQQMQEQMQQMQEMMQDQQQLINDTMDEQDRREQQQAEIDPDEFDAMLDQAIQGLERRTEDIGERLTQQGRDIADDFEQRAEELARELEEADASAAQRRTAETALNREHNTARNRNTGAQNRLGWVDRDIKRLKDDLEKRDRDMSYADALEYVDRISRLHQRLDTLEENLPPPEAAPLPEDSEQDGQQQDGQPQEDQPQDGQQDEQPQDGEQQDGDQQGGQQQGQPQNDGAGQDHMEQLRQQLQQSRDNSQALSRQQNDIRNDLEQLIRDANQQGFDTRKLREASRSMNEAARQLRSNDTDTSIPTEQEALEQLREGAQDLQQQMQERMQPGGAGFSPGQHGGEREGPQQSAPNPSQQIGVDPEREQNRTRAIRDEIRERLENPDLTREERGYLERLLETNSPAEQRSSADPQIIPLPRAPQP